jgi:hypothetical protein
VSAAPPNAVGQSAPVQLLPEMSQSCGSVAMGAEFAKRVAAWCFAGLPSLPT